MTTEHRAPATRHTRRLCTLGATIALAAAAALTTTAGSAAAVTSSAPVGTWQGTAEHDGHKAAMTLSFDGAGKVCLWSDTSDGHGSWTLTSGNQFTFKVDERLHDAAGTTVGWVDVNQTATLSGDKFASSGPSKVYDANHKYLSSTVANIAVTRISTTPRAC